MRLSFILSALTAPISILAAFSGTNTDVAAVVERQTKKRSVAFAQAFIYRRDIPLAFKFIVTDYINHNPAIQNGSDSAWNFSSPIWASTDIVPLRTAFKNPQSWLNYQFGTSGEIVDRFRWEGGCIVEHDQGEKFPTKSPAERLLIADVS